MKNTSALSFALLFFLMTSGPAHAVSQMISDSPASAILLLGGGYGVYVQGIDASARPAWTSPGLAFSQIATTAIMVPDGAGGVIVTWSAYTDNGIDVLAQRVNSSGTALWTTGGIAITNNPYEELVGGIVSDGVGGAILVWEQEDQFGHRTILAQRVNASGTRLWPVDGTLVSGSLQSWNPYAVSDGAGGAIVAWTSQGAYQFGYAQRINASGATQWTSSGMPVAALLRNIFVTSIASDALGGAIVTWHQAGSDGNSDLYAQRVNPTGGIEAWVPDGVAVSTLTGDQSVTGVIPDGTGGAFMTWNGKTRNWLQRISPSGVLLYAGNGVMTSKYDSWGDTGSRYGVNLTSDGAGGVIVAWSDHRDSATNLDIYAQHFDGSGLELWTHWGVPVSRAAWSQQNPLVVSDGSGGAFIAWSDYRPGNPLFTQRISGNGVLTPTAVGRTRTPSLVVSEAHPNPFAEQASFDVVLPGVSPVTAEMFDVAGRRVRTLTISPAGAGLAQIIIDGRDQNANLLPSGVYFCRVHAGAETVTKKLVIAR